jgi:hypothetical protein
MRILLRLRADGWGFGRGADSDAFTRGASRYSIRRWGGPTKVVNVEESASRPSSEPASRLDRRRRGAGQVGTAPTRIGSAY